MKSLKFLIAAAALYFLFPVMSTSLSGCNKTVHDHDTTTLTVHGTTIKTIKDTVTITDSVWNITNGLVAYYNFNGGNLNDSSGHNNNIIFNNAMLTADRLGNANNAYLFDGTTSYMRVANSASINPNNITIFAIVKVNGFYTGTCHGNAILNKGSSDAVDGYYTLRFNDSSIRGASSCSSFPDTVNEFFYGSYGDDIPVGVSTGAGWDSLKVQKGEWYTLTFTYDGHIAKFYLDGALENTQTQTEAFNPEFQ